MTGETAQHCCVCGGPARYGTSLPVCGPGCDQTLGTPEDGIALAVALLVLFALVGIVTWAVLT